MELRKGGPTERFLDIFRRRGPLDKRPLAMRLRHGVIAVLAGDWQVLMNTPLNLSNDLYLRAGALVANVHFNTAGSTNDYAD